MPAKSLNSARFTSLFESLLLVSFFFSFFVAQALTCGIQTHVRTRSRPNYWSKYELSSQQTLLTMFDQGTEPTMSICNGDENGCFATLCSCLYPLSCPCNVAYHSHIHNAFIPVPWKEPVSAVICYTLLTASPKVAQMTQFEPFLSTIDSYPISRVSL